MLPEYQDCLIFSGKDSVAIANSAEAFWSGLIRSNSGLPGLENHLVEDPVAVEKYASRIPTRDESFVHAGSVQFTLSRRHLKAIQRKGGANSRAYMSPRKARALARRAAKARWAKQQNGHGARPVSSRHERRPQYRAAGARATAPQRDAGGPSNLNEDRAGVADRFLAGRLSPQCQRARWIATRRAARKPGR